MLRSDFKWANDFWSTRHGDQKNKFQRDVFWGSRAAGSSQCGSGSTGRAVLICDLGFLQSFKPGCAEEKSQSTDLVVSFLLVCHLKKGPHKSAPNTIFLRVFAMCFVGCRGLFLGAKPTGKLVQFSRSKICKNQEKHSHLGIKLSTYLMLGSCWNEFRPTEMV